MSGARPCVHAGASAQVVPGPEGLGGIPGQHGAQEGTGLGLGVAFHCLEKANSSGVHRGMVRGISTEGYPTWDARWHMPHAPRFLQQAHPPWNRRDKFSLHVHTHVWKQVPSSKQILTTSPGDQTGPDRLEPEL